MRLSPLMPTAYRAIGDAIGEYARSTLMGRCGSQGGSPRPCDYSRACACEMANTLEGPDGGTLRRGPLPAEDEPHAEARTMPTANRFLEDLLRVLRIQPSGGSAESDGPEPTDEKQDNVASEPPQGDEAQCTVTSPWAA
jgi:hypothetical protein